MLEFYNFQEITMQNHEKKEDLQLPKQRFCALKQDQVDRRMIFFFFTKLRQFKLPIIFHHRCHRGCSSLCAEC